jgi:hypothetical protein
VLNYLKIIEGNYIYLYWFEDLVEKSFHNMAHYSKNLIEHLPKYTLWMKNVWQWKKLHILSMMINEFRSR